MKNTFKLIMLSNNDSKCTLDSKLIKICVET